MKKSIISLLAEKLGIEKILSGDAVKERYSHIWRMHDPLQAKAVIFPSDTADVSEIMKICHAQQQPVTVHGGLTNLVGATKTDPDEVVISMEKMNTIEELDVHSRTITVQAGVVLENVQQAVNEKKLLFPLNFGAKGSAQIGGIISTNAGGLRVFRYGMTRNLVLGLEAVLPDGTVISSLKKIIKDNSAYDLKQLFIGSEGTLGIITKAVLKLTEAPKSRISAFVALDSYDKVILLLKFMDGGLAGILSGYELIWESTYQAMTSAPALVTPPLPHGYPYYVLLEGLGSHPVNDQARLQELLEQAFEENLIVDAAIAHSESDLQWFWKIREDVSVLKNRCVIDHHFDVSLPISAIGDYARTIEARLREINGVEQCFIFGHVADGNIHFIVGKPNHEPALSKAINEVVYTPLTALKGSISAEHGIGFDKKTYLPICRSKEEITLMKTLKRALDPLNILNPGRVLDM